MLFRVRGLFKRRGKNHLDDKQIVELYLARDEGAIRQTTQKFGPRLRALS